MKILNMIQEFKISASGGYAVIVVLALFHLLLSGFINILLAITGKQ